MRNIILSLAIAIAMGLGSVAPALAESWTSDTVDTYDTSCIDWYDTGGHVVVVGDYLKIETVFYYVYAAAGTSPWQGDSSLLDSACLQQVSQTDGTLLWDAPLVPTRAVLGNQVGIEWWPYTVNKNSSPS